MVRPAPDVTIVRSRDADRTNREVIPEGSTPLDATPSVSVTEDYLRDPTCRGVTYHPRWAENGRRRFRERPVEPRV